MTATAVASRTSTATPPPTATATPSTTATATPTESPTATATPLDPNASGPWAVGSTTITFVRPSTTTQEPRELATVLWYPAPVGTTGEVVAGGVLDAPLGAGGPFPLLVFSHGSCSLPQQSSFLTARLASYGFVVAAPPHPGNTIFDGPTPERCLLPGPLLADAFLNRADDVVFTIDRMLALSAGTSGAFVGAIDADRIGVLGHSFGGQTTLRIPAADPRVDAVLALAPAAVTLVTPQIDAIAVPAMIQGAELDSLAPFATNSLATYDRLGRPRYLLELLNTGHFAFANACLVPTGTAYPDCAAGTLPQAEANDLVIRFAIPFLGLHVAGNPLWAEWLEADSAPACVHYIADP